MKLVTAIGLGLLSVFPSFMQTAHAQGTAFTYQGRLNANGASANGSYDLVFTLYGDSTVGPVLAGPVTNAATAVTNGLFTTLVDFGPGVFVGGSNWLELAVSTQGSNSFTTLSPLQQITPTPYALTAGSAAAVTGPVNASQLSGSIPASCISGTLTTAQLGANTVQSGNIAKGAVGNSQLARGLTLDGTTMGTFSGELMGNATTATKAKNFSGVLDGDVTGTQGATVVRPRLIETGGQSGNLRYSPTDQSGSLKSPGAKTRSLAEFLRSALEHQQRWEVTRQYCSSHRGAYRF